MCPFETIEPDTTALALRALAWTLSDTDRAGRLLALTGLDPAALRARAGDPVVLAASLCFLENHEPDLIACADALAVTPGDLIAARRHLESQ
jgi:hypothetical protein